MNLDFNEKELEKAFQKLHEIIRDIHDEAPDRKVFPGVTPESTMARFDEPLPEEGTAWIKVLEKVQTDVVGTATCNYGPGYYGYITGGGNQVAVLAETIRAALNQNNLKWHSSPVSSEMEKLVIRWIAEFVGYPMNCAGALLGGGSVANFECLAVARKNKSLTDISRDGLYNSIPLTFYVSEEGHSSFDKAVDILGIGRKYLHKIPVNNQMQINTRFLKEKIIQDKENGLQPACVIGIAGTTNTGAIDNLEELAAICKHFDLWFHVDAAYGGPAAGLPEHASAFGGLELADSLVVNPHKWMYVPFEAAATLYKNPDAVRKTYRFVPDYLRSEDNDNRIDQMDFNLPLTKDFKALKIWMTIKTYGSNCLKEAIQSDIKKAAYLCKLAKGEEKLELLAPAPLSIVCFRYKRAGMNEPELSRLNSEIIRRIESDGRIFLTGTKIRGNTALRVCFINHRSTFKDVEKIINVVVEIGDQLNK